QTVKPSQSIARSSPCSSSGAANSSRTSARGVPACTAARRTPIPGIASRSRSLRKCACALSEIWIMVWVPVWTILGPSPARCPHAARDRSCAARPAGEPAMSDLVPLAQAHGIPRRGGEHKLGEARLRELLPEVPGWELAENGRALTRTFRFDDYHRTMAFVNALAYIAHREDHHPDLGVHYDRCAVRFSTHDVGGLSENDFICAAKADALLG